MKPFFGIDLTTNKKNKQLNGMEFLLVQPSPAMTQAHERAFQKAHETTNRAQLPPALRIAQWISGAVGGIVAIGILKGLGSVSLQEAYQNAGELFWIAGICLLIWTILKLASMHKSKTVMEKDESTQTFSNLEGVCKAIKDLCYKEFKNLKALNKEDLTGLRYDKFRKIGADVY